MVKPDTLARMAGNIAAGMAGNLSQPDNKELEDIAKISVRLALMILDRLPNSEAMTTHAERPTTENP